MANIIIIKIKKKKQKWKGIQTCFSCSRSRAFQQVIIHRRSYLITSTKLASYFYNYDNLSQLDQYLLQIKFISFMLKTKTFLYIAIQGHLTKWVVEICFK